jgi:DNA (cytosine-5)-methyltransferase 1
VLRGSNQAHAAVRSVDAPASTLHFGERVNLVEWSQARPATTVQSDPRVATPGHRDREGGEPQFGAAAIRVSVTEAAILQSFRADYPWQGTKTKQYQQIGNAVPPRLAAHILAVATGLPLPECYR